MFMKGLSRRGRNLDSFSCWQHRLLVLFGMWVQCFLYAYVGYALVILINDLLLLSLSGLVKSYFILFLYSETKCFTKNWWNCCFLILGVFLDMNSSWFYVFYRKLSRGWNSLTSRAHLGPPMINPTLSRNQYPVNGRSTQIHSSDC